MQTMKRRLLHLLGSVVFVSASPIAFGQTIDMSQAHSATVPTSAMAPAPITEARAPQHTRVPVWTRIQVQPGPDGSMRAVCSVERNPLLVHTPRDPNTDTLPTQH